MLYLSSGPRGVLMQEMVSSTQVQMQEQETERLSALLRMELMDTPPEPEFDELVETVAAICDMPMSLVTLLDDRRQWFKAAIGLKVRETPREMAFCTYAIQQPDLLLVEDATADPRFSENPLVTGETHLRFYAGMPISSPDGFPLGTLCVLDRRPRQLTPTQIAALKVLARQVNARMELRLRRQHMEKALAEAKEAQAKLLASEQRFAAFMDSAPFMSFLKRSDGRFLFYNSVMAENFGITQQEWIGKSDTDLFPAELAARYHAHDLEVLTTQVLSVMTEPTLNGDGTTSHWKSYKFPCSDGEGGTLIGCVSVEVTEELLHEAQLRQYQAELEAVNLKLQDLAGTDSLTALANRRVFDERLALEFAQAKRKNRALSVLMLDLDGFKRRNDLYGHQRGDTTLQQFAMLLEKSTREGDLAARYGGEEFVLLLPETGEEQAMLLAERIVQRVRTATWECEPMTVSIGTASLDGATLNQQRLVHLADEALYEAKRSGKDRVVSYRDYYRQVVARIAENQA